MSIGDGKNTDIWSDPWIAELQKLSPTLEFNSDYLKLKKVCDLLNSNGIAWDKDLIEQSFKPEEAQMILNIPLKPGQQDTMIWTPQKQGKFSVKSAYGTVDGSNIVAISIDAFLAFVDS
ncbi:ribonuclease H-like superfamily protein [Striga asiatica]|uniref:Ribonuclease H-like superfamily protein n=1 Tax=Striga asiatica TaxID=4170 RepID=A0A5A7PYU6_STRAF|nr:ribonuclease H-like superfamily protein [Striga asiatica]